jgi:hypothetical protein
MGSTLESGVVRARDERVEDGDGDGDNATVGGADDAMGCVEIGEEVPEVVALTVVFVPSFREETLGTDNEDDVLRGADIDRWRCKRVVLVSTVPIREFSHQK